MSLLPYGALLAGLIGLPACASKIYECPPTMQVKSAQIDVPNDPHWSPGISSDPLPLTGAVIFDGPVDKRGAVKPTAESRDGRRATWAFGASSYPDGKYLVCLYAQGLVTAQMQVEQATKACTIDYLRTKRSPVLVVRASCD
jgi:hypothetical protein